MLSRVTALLAIAGHVTSHTWVEQLSAIDQNNQPIGEPGFIRGYVPRVAPGFTDEDNTFLLPTAPALTFQDSDGMCKPTQAIGNQTNGAILVVPSGSRIVLRYLENGHITQPGLPPNKPSPGQVSVYATTQPTNDERFTAIHGQWTSDRAGGDQRGFLLSTTPFDDGRCFQFDPTRHSGIANERNAAFGPGPSTGETPNRWCGTVIDLNDELGKPFPADTILTLYWVWDWPTYVAGNPGEPATVLNQTYTSCMEVQIV